jgi:hypothetical protein
MGASTSGLASAEARTWRTASTTSAGSTSSSERKTPAIEEASPSSAVDDDRTTSVSPPAIAAASARSSLRPVWSSRQAVVTTRPGRTGRPSARAAARLLALAPVTSASAARGWSRVMRVGAAVASTGCSSVGVRSSDRDALTAR